METPRDGNQHDARPTFRTRPALDVRRRVQLMLGNLGKPRRIPLGLIPLLPYPELAVAHSEQVDLAAEARKQCLVPGLPDLREPQVQVSEPVVGSGGPALGQRHCRGISQRIAA